ncbi:hypothetical protein IP91_01784 [Pseudoduganella lurida]|uniref:Uncharacterized protein n=1 Tax=Pseudoduganella lurida TaxID=1036180 RepID=A0A562RF25_9BURK|nr:hypothetical protein [Pseudoduganella lurida]TWI67667.1 hypothetical protein IP91_01784 [Pseudoduganella lurida]
MMDDASPLARCAAGLQGGVMLAVLLHALAFLPQWRSDYYQRDFLNTSITGLLLAVAHGAVLALARSELPAIDAGGHGTTAAWCLAAALLLNLLIAAQNLCAVHALVRLHRPSALVAGSLRPAVLPLAWTSGVLACAACAAVAGWL